MRKFGGAFLNGTGAFALAAILVGPAALPAVAAPADGNDCICTLQPTQGPVGSVTASVGSVLVNGPDGEIPAPIGTKLSNGSQLSTGEASSAKASFSGQCNVALEASMTLTVSPTDGGLCIKLADESLGGGGDPSALIYTGALLTEGAIIVGSGLTKSVSAQ